MRWYRQRNDDGGGVLIIQEHLLIYLKLKESEMETHAHGKQKLHIN